MADRQVTLYVTRYVPEERTKLYVQTYQVPAWDGMMVLDALNYIREDIDPSLAFRWSCRMGICGSCGMMVNGTAKLTCETPVDDYRGLPIEVAPLDNFPIMRDLVVDIDDFMQKLQWVMPWLIRQEEKPLSEGEYRQTPQQRELYAPHSACINCMLCYAACPIYGIEPEFTGPAAIALSYRYNIDSRDQGTNLRRAVLSRPEAVWTCAFVGECSVVCPKGVMPAESIQRSKLNNVLKWARSTFLPRSEQ